MAARNLRSPRRAEEALAPRVYRELDSLARERRRDERCGPMLQATALVAEVWLRMGSAGSPPDRAAFARAAAEGMRRLLIDQARERGRGGRGARRESPAWSEIADLTREDDLERVLALDGAVRRLESRDPRIAEVVLLRYFAGLAVEEVAALLALSPRAVRREWTYARAWLFRELAPPGSDPA
jgi:RNA polymerase sigma factor (TIGR02999 family)